MNRYKLSLLALALCLMLLPHTARAAVQTLDFSVMRKGGEIGTHSLQINRNGDKTLVTIKTRVTVKFLFATVYSFTFDGTESWEKGKLVALSNTSNDNGENHNVSVKKVDGKLMLTTDGKTSELPDDILPSSWWNKSLVRESELLDIIKGRVAKVTIKKGASEDLDVLGKAMSTDMYLVYGDLTREVWYAKDGTMVKQSFYKKGEQIEYIRK